MKDQSILTTILIVCIVTILFSFFAFYNGYPLLFPGDSLGYYYYGTRLDHDSAVHSFVYGLFVGFTSLGKSLWWTMLIQCLICSCIFIFFLKYFLGKQYNFRLAIIIVLLVGFFTTFTKYSGKIMPDIFTGISLLLFWIFFKYTTNIFQRVMYILGIAIILSMHISLIPIYIVFFIIIFVYSLILKKIDFVKKAIVGFLICLFAIMSTISIHWIFLKELYFNKVSYAFILGKLADNGILHDYLIKYCDTEPNELCEYKDQNYSIGQFMWDVESSPFYKGFGYNYKKVFAARKNSYSEINKRILSKPKYLAKFILLSARNTMIMICNINCKEITGNSVEWAMNEYLPNEKPDYYRSRQVKDQLNSFESALHFLQTVAVVATLLFLIVYYVKIKDIELKEWIIVTLLFLFVNAMICGSLSELDPRYTERTIWLVPFLFIMIVSKVGLRKILKDLKLNFS
ncbi:MAG: hypothetical protein ACKVOU_09160 [Cytophagales bacterium]